MNIAFYAPMKSPHHPRPSGDRRIARLLIKAMQRGHNVQVMTELRAWEGKGNKVVQREIHDRAITISKQLIKDIQARPAEQRPEIWFSYHLYHKAPDWIGPKVAAKLNIPYIVAEASYAAKQTKGPWSAGLVQVINSLQQASAIICLNPNDIPALEQLKVSQNKMIKLHPFLETNPINLTERQAWREKLAKKYTLDPDLPWIISVAMMRDDAKLDSYQHLAKSLKKITLPYHLLLIGDGNARHKVEDLFDGKLARHTHLLGEFDQDATIRTLVACDLFAWPAINEAIGMAILEAQACGLPVVVGNSGAIPEIVHDGKTGFICSPSDTKTMAERIEKLLTDVSLREQFSQAAVNNIEQHHNLNSAANSLDIILGDLLH